MGSKAPAKAEPPSQARPHVGPASAPKDPTAHETKGVAPILAPTWQAKPGERWSIGWTQDLLTLTTSPRGIRVLPARPAAASQILVLLDDARPRPLGAGRSVRELRVEGEEPSPGAHSLVGCAIWEQKLDCQEITFHLDARQRFVSSEAGATGRCILLEPGGTYFGAQAVPLLVIRSPSSSTDSLAFEAKPLTNFEIGRWGGPRWPWSAEFLRRDELALEAGDYTISLTCAANESPVERIITVNAEESPR